MLTYQGIAKNSSGEWSDPRLVQARSNSYSFLLTGTRRLLVREYSTECVLTLFTRELSNVDSDLQSLLSGNWFTNKAVCKLFDATSRLGFGQAQVAPQISSVLVQESLPSFFPRKNFNRLYDLEPDIKFIVLALLGQTNAVKKTETCTSDWEDFSSIRPVLSGIENALSLEVAKVEKMAEGTYSIRFNLNGNATIVAQFSPGAEIWVPSVVVSDKTGEIRRIQRLTISGQDHNSEWVDAIIGGRDGVVGKTNRIYYFSETNLDENVELEAFSTRFLKGAKQTARISTDGKVEERLDGEFWRAYGVKHSPTMPIEKRSSRTRLVRFVFFATLLVVPLIAAALVRVFRRRATKSVS